jgi:hypothetical protein
MSIAISPNAIVKIKNCIIEKMPAVLIQTESGSSIHIDDCFIQYMDMISFLLGIEISYEEFSKLNSEERKAYIIGIKRNIKLKKLDI